jgi:hypothetical protein
MFVYLYTYFCRNEVISIILFYSLDIMTWRAFQVSVFAFFDFFLNNCYLKLQYMREDIRKGCRRVNMVEILCTKVMKMEKWDFFDTVLRTVRRWDKGEWWRGWIQLRYIVSTFVNVTRYPQYNNNIIKILLDEWFIIYSAKLQYLYM